MLFRSKGQKTFVCPYHAWTYGRDGHLIGITEEKIFGPIDKASHGLRRLPVAERDGLIWVSAAPDGSIDIDRLLDGLAPEIAAYGFERYVHFETRVLRQKMNWKLVIDTFLEGYHIQVLHKNTVAPILHGTTIDFQHYGPNIRMTLPRKSITELRGLPEAQWDVLRHTAIVYILFPNVVLIWQGDHIETWRVYPAGNGTDEAVMHVSLYAPAPVTTEKSRQYWAKNMDLLLRTVELEDFPLGEDIQRGFHSGAQDHITFGRNEPCLAHYHRSIKQALQLA